MEFLIGVLVGGLMVGGTVLAKVLAMKAEAATRRRSRSPAYLSGKGRPVVPAEPVEIDPCTGHGKSW